MNGSQAPKKTERKSPGAPGLLPETGRWAEKHGEQKRSVLKMEFKGFLNAFLRLPCQIVRMGRRIVVRLLSWNPAGGVLEGRGRSASDVRFAARAARFKPVPTAALLRPRHDAGIRMSRFVEAPNDRTEVTMKQTQPNTRKLTAVPVNGERLRRLRSARIALTG